MLISMVDTLKSFARCLMITSWERIRTRLLFYGNFVLGMKFVMVRRVHNDFHGLFSCVYLCFRSVGFGYICCGWLLSVRFQKFGIRYFVSAVVNCLDL
jgi:hypothetical protein